MPEASLAHQWRRDRRRDRRVLIAYSHSEPLGLPLEAELVGRGEVSDQGRGGHDGRRREISLAADAHAVLPVAVEGRDRPLPLFQRVRSLSETGAAPRLADLAAGRSND